MRDHTKSLIQRVPTVMTPLLVVAFSATLAKLLWTVLAPPQDVVAAPKVSAPAPIQTRPAANLGKVIADNHLFGEIKRSAPPVVKRTMPRSVQPVAATPEPTEPPIKVSLHGIWSSKRATGRTEDAYKSVPIEKVKLDAVSQIRADLGELFDEPETVVTKKPSNKNKSSAIMSIEGGDQRMFSEKDMLADGGQQIFLADGDQPAPKIAGNKSTPKPVRTMPKAVSANLAAAHAQQRNPAASSESPTQKRGETLGQRDLRKLREDIINDASLLQRYSAPEPLLLDGQVKGYRLHLSNRLRLLYQVGFRPGDVVTELNGVRLQDPSAVQEALYNFVSSDQMAISVMRGQEEETFRYSF